MGTKRGQEKQIQHPISVANKANPFFVSQAVWKNTVLQFYYVLNFSRLRKETNYIHVPKMYVLIVLG